MWSALYEASGISWRFHWPVAKISRGRAEKAGVQLHKVQLGLEPSDWKPMTTVGPGVREIRIREESGAFRVIYVAHLLDAVVVLHAFQKKTQQTPKRDLDLAAARLKQI